MEVSEVIRKYGLSPLEGEGGYFRFVSSFSSLDAGFIYYLITPESFSSLHRLSSDELWFFLEGGRAQQIIYDEDRGEKHELILSEDCRHSLVRAGLWQATRLVSGEYALFSTVMCPRFSSSMYFAPHDGLLQAEPSLKEVFPCPQLL